MLLSIFVVAAVVMIKLIIAFNNFFGISHWQVF